MLSFPKVLLCLAAAAGPAGCAGGLSTGLLPRFAGPAPYAAPLAAAGSMAVPTSGYAQVSLSGRIKTRWNGGFTMLPDDRQQLVRIYTTDRTVYVGAYLFAGAPVDVVGTYSTHRFIVATRVSEAGPIRIPRDAVSLVGRVRRVYKTYFSVKPESRDRELRVYYGSETSYSRTRPAIGAYILAEGRKSKSRSMRATYIATFRVPPPTVTVSGTIESFEPFGFRLGNGRYRGIPITLSNSSDVSGVALEVDADVEITGIGLPDTALYATRIVRNHAKPSPSPSPSPTAQPSVAPSVSPDPGNSPTPSPDPTATQSPTPEPTATSTPTPDPTQTPSPTPVPEPTVTPTAVPTTTPVPTPVPTATPAPPSPAPSPAPSPLPTIAPVGLGPAHVLTADYLYQASSTYSVSPSAYVPYVTWASGPKTSYMAAIHAAGIKVYQYMDLNRAYSSSGGTQGTAIAYTDIAPGGAHNGAAGRDCSGNLQPYSAYGGTAYLTDPRSPDAAGHAAVTLAATQQYVVSMNSGNSLNQLVDAYFADDTYEPLSAPSPCGYLRDLWHAALNSVDASVNVPLIINTFGGSHGTDMATVQSRVTLLSPPNVVGAMYESCLGGHGGWGQTTPVDWVPNTSMSWFQTEYSQIQTVLQHKSFWCYQKMTGDGATLVQKRLYAYASFLLTYDPAYSVYQTAMATPSKFLVFPETGLVPMNPTVTATDVSGYLQSSGAYVRHFNSCYYRGTLVGPCAVAVNPSPSATAMLTEPFAHSAMLSGDGVLDGGSMSFNGPAVTVLPPTTAAILF